MTTIAYTKGVMAGDSFLTDDDLIWHRKCRKVFKLRDGSLYGGAGDSENCMIMLDALKKGIMVPSLPVHGSDGSDIHAVRVTKDGEIFFFEGHRWCHVPEPYIAVGSGRKAALALLRYGATAVEAVKGAIWVDPFSGGRVTTVSLKASRRGSQRSRKR
jgi:20S proteasome alpha/beta subunit